MSQGKTAPAPGKDGSSTRIGPAADFLQQALDAYKSGQHGRAEVILGQIAQQCPRDGAVWHLRGTNAAAAGNLRPATQYFIKAIECDTENAPFCASLASHLTRLDLDHAAIEPWARAVALAPDNIDYQVAFAHCLARLGRSDDALPHFEIAARMRPADAGLLTAYGTALSRAGHHSAAIGRLHAAIEATPTDPAIIFRLGHAQQLAGQTPEAAGTYRAVLALAPQMHEARLNLTACLLTLGDNETAIEQCRHILEHRPDSSGAMNNLGSALCNIGRHGEAIVVLENALRHEPENLNALHNLGVALHAENAFQEAEACFRKCLKLRPNWHEAQQSLANLLRACGNLTEAAQFYRAVIDSRPLDFKSYGNLGLILLNLNKPHDAISVYEKAIALAPKRADLQLGLGIAQLLTGDFADGWTNYEARLQMSPAQEWRPGHGLPRWQGEKPDPAGDRRLTVLVHAEQGFGDTLQFCRYIPLISALGAKVVFECQPALASLMDSLALLSATRAPTVIAPSDAMPPADFHVPLLSLPKIFESDLNSIPADIPYLSAPAAKAAAWSRFPFGEKPAIGLVWAGNPDRQDDHLRSCPIDALAPILAIPGVRFFSLQKGARRQSVPEIVDLGQYLDDFGDTAAAIERMALVISVDTAAAHLAGALGRPVWVMLGHAADWRYLLDREDSPWYPTMRLFRQAETGNWQSVADRIAAALSAFLTDRR